MDGPLKDGAFDRTVMPSEEILKEPIRTALRLQMASPGDCRRSLHTRIYLNIPEAGLQGD